jgi:hypothetical protein
MFLWNISKHFPDKIKSHSRKPNSIVYLYSDDLLSLKCAMFLHVRLAVILLHLAKLKFFRRSLCWPWASFTEFLKSGNKSLTNSISYNFYSLSSLMCTWQNVYKASSTIQHAIYKFYFLDPKSIPLAPLIMFCTTFRCSNTISVMIRIRVGYREIEFWFPAAVDKFLFVCVCVMARQVARMGHGRYRECQSKTM